LGTLVKTIMEMNNSKPSPINWNNPNRPLLLFSKDDLGYTWSTLPPRKEIRWDVFCRTNSKWLFALEDFGKGRDGRVWLVCNANGSVAVLKFSKSDKDAVEECGNWHLVYNTFIWFNNVRAERWSRRPALLMPRCSQFHTTDERLGALDDLKQTLLTCFVKNKRKHNDVRWRNVGYFYNGKTRVVILFDLAQLVVEETGEWVTPAINSLKLSAGSAENKDD